MEISLINGATGGLGKEFAKQLVSRGEKVFLTGRDEKKLILLKEELLAKYENAFVDYYPCE